MAEFLDQGDLLDDVPSGGSNIEPGVYLVKLARIERAPDGQFGKRIAWIFNLADSKARTPIFDADGSLLEFRHTTSAKLGPKAKAREFAEALLGRELVIGEPGAAVAKECIGKTAQAVIAPNEREWTEITRMTPLKVKPEPVAVGAASGPDPFDL